MKASLHFKLPEERADLDDAVNAQKFKSVISELDNWLRGKIKYEDLPEQESNAYQKARDKIHEFLNEEDLSLW